jgi:radical SAM protein with 4Fe4S-binding SPASM domain
VVAAKSQRAAADATWCESPRTELEACVLSLEAAPALALVNGNVLENRVSGAKLVLDSIGVRFFEIFQEYGTAPEAARLVAREFGIPLDRASADYERFVDRIDQGQRCEGSTLPGRHHAVLEPTAACNGGCVHCYHTTHSPEWPKSAKTRILASLADAGIRSVSITGGEVFAPSFLDEFFELVAALHARDIVVSSVSTNATFITEEVRDRVLQNLPSHTVLRISMDALRSDLLDRIRPGYRKLPDPYFPILDLDQAGHSLVFTTNISEQRPDDIVAIGNYLRAYRSIRTWNVRLMVPVHYESGPRLRKQRLRVVSSRPDPRLPLEHYHRILVEHAQHPFPFDVHMGNYLHTAELCHPHALTPRTDPHPCGEDQFLMTIKSTGAVTQCPILTELLPELSMGSAFDSEFALDADYEHKLPLADMSVERMPCASCHLRPICGGGCRLYAVAYDEGLEGCDLPARELLSWIESDPTGILRQHWPDYHRTYVNLLAIT